MNLKFSQDELDIIIVNFNSGELLKNCLMSVDKNIPPGLIVNAIVVDNNSSDGSGQMETVFKNIQVRMIYNHQNVGFAKACNQGAAVGKAPFLLFLNPDTKILHPEALSIPLNVLKFSAETAMVGIQLIDELGNIMPSTGSFPTLKTYFISSMGLHKLFKSFCKNHFNPSDFHHQDREVDFLLGAFIMIKRDIFEKFGGFDEDYFVYYEEIDLARRIKQAGYKIQYISAAKAFHKGGGTTETVRGLRYLFSLNSRWIYARKNFSRWNFYMAVLILVCIEPIFRIPYHTLKDGTKGFMETIWGYVHFLKSRCI